MIGMVGDDFAERCRQFNDADDKKDAERYRWLLAKPAYPFWKAIALISTHKQRTEAIDSLMKTHL